MAGASSSSSLQANFIMEERNELMIPPKTGGQSLIRTAHFLLPSVASVDGPGFTPSIPPTMDWDGRNLNQMNLGVEAEFQGWNHPQSNWTAWIEHMHALHHLTWRASEIYEAIMSSKYIIHRKEDLILRFAEKWSPDTNTFVFPWGEATVTLEDVMELGGFSVLGASNLTPIGDNYEMRKIQNIFHHEWRNVADLILKRASQSAWIDKFMNSGSEIEHLAFIVYWLSRFVFPILAKDCTGETIIPLAIHLSRGTRIALAPAVLASIYRDLRLLKKVLDTSRNPCFKGAQDGFLTVRLSAPLQLLQAWIWERFPMLRPTPNPTLPTDPKMARWDSLQFDAQNISNCIDSAADHFLWRPYSGGENHTSLSQTRKDKAEWVQTKPHISQDVMALARCWRVSELVGPEADSIEQYLPHRVAMQFGLDQDVPGFVSRVNSSPQAAWRYYTRPIDDERLYIPARLSESDVTTRYFFWWRKLTSAAGKRPVVPDYPPGFQPVVPDHPPGFQPNNNAESNVNYIVSVARGDGNGENDRVGKTPCMQDISNLEEKLRELEKNIALYKGGN